MGVSDQNAEENIGKEEKATQGWGKPLTEELRNLCSTRNIIMTIKFKTTKFVGDVEC